MRIVFSNGKGQVQNDYGIWPITSLPSLPFYCAGIFFDDQSYYFYKIIGGGRDSLSKSEIAAVKEIVKNMRPPTKVGAT